MARSATAAVRPVATQADADRVRALQRRLRHQRRLGQREDVAPGLARRGSNGAEQVVEVIGVVRTDPRQDRAPLRRVHRPAPRSGCAARAVPVSGSVGRGEPGAQRLGLAVVEIPHDQPLELHQLVRRHHRREAAVAGGAGAGVSGRP